MLDATQQALVHTAMQELEPNLPQAGAAFLERLDHRAPELHSLFASRDYEPATPRLGRFLVSVTGLMSNEAALLPLLEEAGRLHASRGSRAEHYELVGACLMETLQTFLPNSWSPEMEDAWLDLYAEMSRHVEAVALGTAG